VTSLNQPFTGPQTGDESVGSGAQRSARPEADRHSSIRVIKHSIVIAGHRTSVSLEDAFWRALKEISANDGVSLAALVARVDAGRGGANLSSTLRVFVLERVLEASGKR
jgi:predicted DNA-binding ribbon-helix-helix protein